MLIDDALKKVKEDAEGGADAVPRPAVLDPDYAMLVYRTSDEGFDDNVQGHLGKFLNRFGVFGYFSEKDRSVYMAKFMKWLDLKAALDGITDEELKKEPEAEAVLFSALTMSKEGFTTKELTTQRVYEQGRPRENRPGIIARLFGRRKEEAEVEAT